LEVFSSFITTCNPSTNAGLCVNSSQECADVA
jgi:hypothetical protein